MHDLRLPEESYIPQKGEEFFDVMEEKKFVIDSCKKVSWVLDEETDEEYLYSFLVEYENPQSKEYCSVWICAAKNGALHACRWETI